MRIKPLTIAEIEYVTYTLAKQTMAWNEPIPSFSSRFPGKLESCLATPFQSFGRQTFYQGLMGKSSILFYLMIKNHPFENGNKRIAMTTLFYFLYKHKKWIRVDSQELYNFAKWVAESNTKLKNETIAAVHKFITTHVIAM